MARPRSGRPSSLNREYPEGPPARGGGRNYGAAATIGKIDYGPTGPPSNKPPTNKPKPKPKPQPSGVASWLAQLEAIFGPQTDYLKSAIEREQSEAAQQAAEIQAKMTAFAKWYGEHQPQQIQNIYNTAAGTQGYLAKGYADGMKIAQDQAAAEANEIMSSAGSPAEARITPTSDAANVLYGIGGGIPGSTLSKQGAAFGAAATFMPGAIASEGAKNATQILKDAEDRVFELRGLQAELLSKKAEAGFTLREKIAAERKIAIKERQAAKATAKADALKARAARQNEAIALYNAGLIDKKQLAKILRMPLKGPGLQPEVEPPTTKTVGGDLWQWNPRTGQWVKVVAAPDDQAGGPSNKPPKTLEGANGETYVWQQNKDGSWSLMPMLPGKPKDKPKAPGAKDRAAAVAAARAAQRAGETFESALDDIPTWEVPIAFAQSILAKEYGMKWNGKGWVYTKKGLQQLAQRYPRKPAQPPSATNPGGVPGGWLGFNLIRRTADFFGFQFDPDAPATLNQLITFIVTASKGKRGR